MSQFIFSSEIELSAGSPHKGVFSHVEGIEEIATVLQSSCVLCIF